MTNHTNEIETPNFPKYDIAYEDNNDSLIAMGMVFINGMYRMPETKKDEEKGR